MKYYCIGIKGSGMSTLAQILYDLGNSVSGYDDHKGYKFTQKGIDDRNIKIYYGHDHDIDKDTIVTYSVAFKPDHPEMIRVKELGLTVKPYSEIMGDVIDMFESIGVSGTHGKTTTSSIIRHILEHSVGCNYFIGAGDGHATKDNKYFVVESDEFNKHFLHYKPTYSIITYIEEEHMECYKDLDDIKESFTKFANQTKDLVIANGDLENIRSLKIDKTLYYGFNDNNDVVIKDAITTDKGSMFKLYDGDKLIGEFFIPLYGMHNVMNATAAILMAIYLKIDINKIKEALETFVNAARRFVLIEEKKNVIIDDYAHHPTEIKATLKAARNKYKDKKIIAIFKPNVYSRFVNFKDQYIEAFNEADYTYLTKVESNREKYEDYVGYDSNIITDVCSNCSLLNEKDMSVLKEYKDVCFVVMSCADVANIIDVLKEYNNEK
jgi:UDP-N-acetylmuramate--L-alanine ligase